MIHNLVSDHSSISLIYPTLPFYNIWLFQSDNGYCQILINIVLCYTASHFQLQLIRNTVLSDTRQYPITFIKIVF